MASTGFSPLKLDYSDISKQKALLLLGPLEVPRKMTEIAGSERR